VGHADRATVLREYQGAQIVAVPSRLGAGGDQDGTPVVLMEAMALGIPVIASSLGGIAEQVTHDETGLLVEPDDPASLAAALDRLLIEPGTRNRLAAAAADHADAELDIAVIAARLEADIRQRLAA
jgi:glycosyltransferase involved in cell wall biosynthesis